jgi:hypothetical protein
MAASVGVNAVELVVNRRSVRSSNQVVEEIYAVHSGGAKNYQHIKRAISAARTLYSSQRVVDWWKKRCILYRGPKDALKPSANRARDECRESPT